MFDATECFLTFRDTGCSWPMNADDGLSESIVHSLLNLPPDSLVVRVYSCPWLSLQNPLLSQTQNPHFSPLPGSVSIVQTVAKSSIKFNFDKKDTRIHNIRTRSALKNVTTESKGTSRPASVHIVLARFSTTRSLFIHPKIFTV